MLVGVRRACQLGYDVIPFPGVTAITEAAAGGTQIADGLRQSVLNLLAQTPLANGGPHAMYMEADAYPKISCLALEKVIHDAPADWEVLQLFANNLIQYNDPGEATVEYDPMKGIEWKRIGLNFTEYAGTHAMVFKDKIAVQKFREAILNSTDAIDVLLAKLNLRDRLKVYRPVKHNFFVPYNPDKTPPRDRRFLVGMMSYRRIKDACRQIYTFMDQSYTNFVMHVLLKGVDEHDFNVRLLPNFKHFINEGRLVIDCVPNENQILNLLQLPKGIPEESYDLITKVDDDDWYDRDYMKRLNDVHRHLPTNVSSLRAYLGGCFKLEAGFPVFSGSRVYSFNGSTMVSTKELFHIIREYVDKGYNTEYIKQFVNRPDYELEDEYRWREDNLQYSLIHSLGCIDRTYIDPVDPGICVTYAGVSMTRDGYLNHTRKTNYKLLTYDRVITVLPSGKRYRIISDSIFLLKRPDIDLGEIIDKDDHYIIVKWRDNKKVEMLRRAEDGSWAQQPVDQI